MIEYKELSALPFKEFITVKRPKGWISNDLNAYSAELHTTKRGIETLCICVYKVESFAKRTDPLRIKERHYINSLGDVGGEMYTGVKFVKSDCSVGTSGGDCMDKYSLTNSLLGEYIGENWVALKNADKTILDFAERHEALRNAKPKNNHKYTRGICWAAFYQQYVRYEKAKLTEENRKKRTINRMQVIGNAPREFFDWVYDDVLTAAPWFYRYDRKKQQKGFCGSCNKQGVLERVKHDTERICPRCGKTVRLVNVNASSGGCNSNDHIRYYTTAIYTERHGDEFLSRFFYLENSFRYKDDQTYNKFKRSTVERDQKHREYRRTFWRVSDGKAVEKEHYFNLSYHSEWERIPPKRAEQDRELGPLYPGNIIEITQSLDLLRVKNMDLRALCLINKSRTPAQIFNAVSNCPAIESMAKMGLNNIARRYLDLTYWDKKTELECSPARLLGINKDVLAEFIKIDVTPEQLAFWRKNKLKLSEMEDFKLLCARYKQKYSKIGDIMSEYGISLQAATNYIERQRTFVHGYLDILMYWADYLYTASLIGINLSDHNAKFPRDIRKEHDRCTALYTVNKNEHLETGLQSRGELLAELSYTDDSFVIEPLRTVLDFVNESSVLNHCVKTYVENCARGSTNIFGLRKKNALDTPYYTVNIDNSGKLIQNRGRNNCPPTEEVREFVTKWLKFVSKQLKTFSIDPKKAENKVQVRIGA